MAPKRILFLTEGQVGDSLVLTPAIRAVKRSFPSCFVSVLVVERYTLPEETLPDFSDLTADVEQRERRVLGTNPNVDELLIVARNRLRSLRGFKRAAAELAIVQSIRKRKFDTIVCTWPEDRFSLWAILSGAAIRVGQRKTGLHFLLTHKPSIEKADCGILDYYCELVRQIGATIESKETEYLLPESSRRATAETLQAQGIAQNERFVAVHPGATADYKIWPPERFAALIDHLMHDQKIRVVLCQGPLDQAIIDEILKCVRSRPIRVVGDTAAVIQRAALCVSNDSGPRHISVALGKASLAFFRQSQEKEWGVYDDTATRISIRGREQCAACPPGVCKDLVPDGERYGAYCMRMISVEEAIVSVRKVLAELG